eukprot:gb/GEZN01016195.1/.p1 GENE.gb/GEZN01016195.1/~~gb/GEZN01016195.1/.p1  ORF type:complete len:136 (+),score=2.89 gb/GEZN01016195.1/:149-556(+)
MYTRVDAVMYLMHVHLLVDLRANPCYLVTCTIPAYNHLLPVHFIVELKHLVVVFDVDQRVVCCQPCRYWEAIADKNFITFLVPQQCAYDAFLGFLPSLVVIQDAEDHDRMNFVDSNFWLTTATLYTTEMALLLRT